MEHSIAIITARGGSKRIPGKNIRPFCGKPMIAYSIQAALDAGLFDEVMVSTDSEEIADIARMYGANVPFYRSEKTSGDYASTADALLEVLAEYETLGRTFAYMACIYPTAPFVTAEKLKDGFWLMQEKHAAAVMPVVAFSYPPQRAYILENGRLCMRHKENFNRRSQDLEKMYHDCGQFYLYETARFQKFRGQITEGIVPIIVDEMEVQDIDHETDWKLAELKYRMMVNEIG